MMALARLCDACRTPILARYLRLSAALLRAEQGETQDPLEAVEGDYCPACLKSGKALVDLLSGFTKYPRAGR